VGLQAGRTRPDEAVESRTDKTGDPEAGEGIERDEMTRQDVSNDDASEKLTEMSDAMLAMLDDFRLGDGDER
jgi:hypothetical protein